MNPAVETPKRSYLLKAAALWLAIAALALVALYARLLHLSFDGDYQGWASASCMTMAHSFNQLGALHTHFVPIQNNLPLGSDPDVYLHWPPLFPLLLSFVTRILGDHESSGRLFALAITLATTCVVIAIARRLYGTRVALLSGFFFLTARATYEGGRAILHQPLAIFFGSATVLLFLLAVDIPSTINARHPPHAEDSSPLSAFSPPSAPSSPHGTPSLSHSAFLLSSIYLRRRDAIRLASTLPGCRRAHLPCRSGRLHPRLPSTLSKSVRHHCLSRWTQIQRRILHAAFTPSSIAFTTAPRNFPSSAPTLTALRWLFEGFGTFTLLAPFLFLAFWLQSNRRQNATAVYLLGGLGLPWLLFFAVMRNYVSIHPFALVLGAPFLAITSGFVLDLIWDRLHAATVADNNRRHLLRVMVVIFPLLILYPLLMAVRNAKIPFEAPQVPGSLRHSSSTTPRPTP